VLAVGLSAVTIRGFPAWAYSHNLELLWVPLISPLIAPLTACIFLPAYAAGNFYALNIPFDRTGLEHCRGKWSHI
jgi:Na+/proline symporter